MSGRRIVHVTPYYPPHLGGVEVVARQLAESMAGPGVDVRVLTSSIGSSGAAALERAGGVTVRRQRGFEVAHTPFTPGLLPALLRLPRDTIVHVHVAHAYWPEITRLGAALRRRPYLLHFHLDVDATGRLGRLLPAYKRHLLGPALRAAARVVVLNPAQAGFVADTYRVPLERISVVGNGVGEEFHALGQVRRQRPPRDPAARLELLFVGRLSPQKRVARLIEAVRMLPDGLARLTVVGDGEERDLVRSLAAPAGERIRLLGGRCGPALHAELAAADAFVLPSDKEGMPLVLLEAMAAGLPVIATDVPGSRDLVAGVGLLADPTPTALAAAISALARDETLRQRLSAASLDAVRHRSWAAVSRRMLALYETVGTG